MDELRIVLLGKQGAGKSTSGNTLLRNHSFHTAASSERVTKACSMSMSTADKQTIKVIDTPGWCDSSRFETDIKQEIIKCISMSSPGPHVFLLVLPIGRFTNEEINTVMNILKEFGDEVTKYMIVLFTKGDDLEERPIEDYLRELHSNLKTIIKLCGERYHVFNNRDKNNHHQVSSLLKKINEMVESNKEKCYTTAMYQKVKDGHLDNKRRQQCRKETEKSVQDKSKNQSGSENKGRRNRYDAEEGNGITEDRKEQNSWKRKMAQLQNSTQNREHDELKEEWKRDLEDKNEDNHYTPILQENRREQEDCKRKMTELQNSTQNREHEGLKQRVKEGGKRDLCDQEDCSYNAKVLEENDEKMRRLPYGMRNVEASSSKCGSLFEQNLPEEVKKLKKERQELERRLWMKDNELKLERQKVHHYEQLKQEEKKYKQIIERKQENKEEKCMAIQNLAQMEHMLKEQTTNEKTKATYAISELWGKFQQCFK